MAHCGILPEDTVNAKPQFICADVTFTDLDNNLRGATLAGRYLETATIRNLSKDAADIDFSVGAAAFEARLAAQARGVLSGTITADNARGRHLKKGGRHDTGDRS